MANIQTTEVLFRVIEAEQQGHIKKLCTLTFNLYEAITYKVPPCKNRSEIVVPHVPVLCILHCVRKRSVSSFRQCQGEDSTQQRGGTEDEQGCSRAVVVKHVY